MADNNKKTKHAGGRPKKPIDMEQVEKLASIQCTMEEIAFFFDIDVSTLHRNKEFCNVYKKAKEGGKMSLRRIQWKLAQNNTTMAIWLGKQYLGQKELVEEKQEETIQIVNDIPKVNNINNDSNI